MILEKLKKQRKMSEIKLKPNIHYYWLELKGLSYDENGNKRKKSEYPFEWTNERLEKVNEKITKGEIKLEKGDFIIHKGIIRERNEGLLMWNGEKVIDLDYVVDEYGHLPKDFCVLENDEKGNFIDENYWNEISHNNLVWLNLKRNKNEIENNKRKFIIDEKNKVFKKILKSEIKEYCDLEEILYYSYFIRNDKTYYILFDSECLNLNFNEKVIAENCFEGVFLLKNYNKYLED